MRNKFFKKIIIFLIFLFIAGVSGYFIFNKKQAENNQETLLVLSSPSPMAAPNQIDGFNQTSDNLKTYTFNSFHGSTDISDKFRFQYPADWFNEGQYFSPQKIQFYNMYSIKAPIHFDLVLAEIFHLTELQYQIDNSKRKNPDSVGQIDGKEFKKYDLIDYGSYGGDSAGRVKIFVGPKIKIDGQDYILVFHWEENPLAEYVPGNDIEVFDNMLLTLKFFQ